MDAQDFQHLLGPGEEFRGHKHQPERDLRRIQPAAQFFHPLLQLRLGEVPRPMAGDRESVTHNRTVSVEGGVVNAGEAYHRKSEGRNPKAERRPKSETRTPDERWSARRFGLRTSAFFRPSDFLRSALLRSAFHTFPRGHFLSHRLNRLRLFVAFALLGAFAGLAGQNMEAAMTPETDLPGAPNAFALAKTTVENVVRPNISFRPGTLLTGGVVAAFDKEAPNTVIALPAHRTVRKGKVQVHPVTVPGWTCTLPLRT